MKITAPVKGFNGEVVGVRFQDGTATTDSPGALNYFRRQGYQVGDDESKGEDQESEDQESEGEDQDQESEDQESDYDLNDLTRDQLRELAQDRGIEVGSAAKKQEIIEALS